MNSNPKLNRLACALSQFSNMPPEGFVRREVVEALLGIGRSTLWRHVRQGKLPPPQMHGTRLALWRVGDVRKCLAAIGGAA